MDGDKTSFFVSQILILLLFSTKPKLTHKTVWTIGLTRIVICIGGSPIINARLFPVGLRFLASGLGKPFEFHTVLMWLPIQKGIRSVSFRCGTMGFESLSPYNCLRLVSC